jgi:hypothetical protein
MRTWADEISRGHVCQRTSTLNILTWTTQGECALVIMWNNAKLQPAIRVLIATTWHLHIYA